MTEKPIALCGRAGSAAALAELAAVAVAVAPPAGGRPGPQAARRATALAPMRNRLQSTFGSPAVVTRSRSLRSTLPSCGCRVALAGTDRVAGRRSQKTYRLDAWVQHILRPRRAGAVERMTERIDRREFLRRVGLGAGATVLASCIPQTGQPGPTASAGASAEPLTLPIVQQPLITTDAR